MCKTIKKNFRRGKKTMPAKKKLCGCPTKSGGTCRRPVQEGEQRCYMHLNCGGGSKKGSVKKASSGGGGCGRIKSEAKCKRDEDCGWDEENEKCRNFTKKFDTCADIDSEDDCDENPNCAWKNGKCRREFEGCGKMNKSQCGGQPNCNWNGKAKKCVRRQGIHPGPRLPQEHATAKAREARELEAENEMKYYYPGGKQRISDVDELDS